MKTGSITSLDPRVSDLKMKRLRSDIPHAGPDAALLEDCGRWLNGKLGYQCGLAGTEWCDWECPIGLPSRK